MLEFMDKLAKNLEYNLSVINLKKNNEKILSISTSSIDKLKIIINYISNFPLLGIKNKDFQD
jgi:hypothetical protein